MLCNVPATREKNLFLKRPINTFLVFTFFRVSLSPIQLALTLNAEHAMLLGPIILITYYGSCMHIGIVITLQMLAI